MIRDTISDDIDGLITLAKATGLFEEEQLDELTATIEQCCQGETNEICVTDFETDPVGVAYLAPERMTDGTWNLYLLAVHPKYQRQGRGAALIDYVEKRLIQDKVRLLLVETAGTDDFEYVREFYRQNGFQQEATVRDFYIAGVDKIIFRKDLG